MTEAVLAVGVVVVVLAAVLGWVVVARKQLEGGREAGGRHNKLATERCCTDRPTDGVAQASNPVVQHCQMHSSDAWLYTCHATS